MLTHKARTKLLPRLKKFYRNEERGYPHRDADLFDLAYDLAECLEDYASNSFDEEETLELVARLRSNPNVTNIDTGVNALHRDALNYGLATDAEMHQFLTFYNNLAEFLLSR